MKKLSSRKLHLNTQTLKTLTGQSLTNVAGGNEPNQSDQSVCVGSGCESCIGNETGQRNTCRVSCPYTCHPWVC